jgi:hypothetical protein
MLKTFFTTVTRSLISLAGVVLTTISAVVFLSLFAIEVIGDTHHSTYTGIIAFLFVPAMFIFGLLLIPLGLWRLRRLEAKRAPGEEVKAPVIDFNQPRTRLVFAGVSVLSVVNIVIFATGTYKGVETMESTRFCGTACHSVMSPEFTTYQRSPHSNVGCVECHVGPGADNFVKAKMRGSWQLISVSLDLVPRPIPTPVETLRPANETCGHCHQPEKWIGDKLKIIPRFADDEANTAKKSVLLVKVGGTKNGVASGAHWHASPGTQLRYRGDTKRQYVAEIELSLPDGGVRAYKNEDPLPEGQALSESWRTMDCTDCHNRATHVYRRPRDEVDEAMAMGDLDPSLPFLKREAMRAVQVPYASWTEMETGLEKDLTGFYTANYPDLMKTDAAKVTAATKTLAGIYRANIYPEMKIQWGSYPNFRDHFEDSGCFRCHTGNMKTAEGKKVGQKCDTCHTVIAEEEEAPEILELLGE